MKTYIIKPEYADLWGSDVNSMTTFTEDDVKRAAFEFEKSEDELLEQLIELKPSAYRAIHRFPGKPSWQELNELIRMDSGCDEDFFDTEDDYKRAVRDGFVKYDLYYTTIYVDD